MGKLLALGKQSAPAKRLIPVMAMLAMLIPAASFALGLGNITMHSALNQPLDAEVELLSVQRGDLTNLVVKLGSDEDFQRVGADRAFFLTKMKFEVVRRKNGTAFVKLSTTKTVTEPFLDFVVEARWPRGRILREFTVLVDPPVLSKEAPAPVSQPAAAARPAAPAPASRRAQTTRQAPIQSRAEMAPVSRQPGELTYGPVKYNDTLFEIANEIRPSSVTVNQMMTALLRENPNAFYNGNVNQLKAGYVLRVSDLASLDALSVADATAEINRQHNEWRDRKSGKLVRQADAPAGGRVAREGDAAPSSRSAADQARLKLVAPGSQGAGSGSGDGNVQQLQEDLLLAAEALDANRQETDELKTRLLEMEEQLEAMQRLIMLKDDEMAGMQNQLGVEATPAEPEATMADPEAVTDEAAADDAAITAMAESMPAEGEATEMPAEGEAAVETSPVAVPAPVTMEEPGLLDDPMVMYGGIGVLLLIIAAVVQRRRKMADSFEESILNVGGEAGVTAETMTQGGESSMVSDFAMSEMSGMSGIEADAADVDPISEADVYLAYGRHQQAEDILNEALEKEPGRNEIKLKLLEVAFAAKNRESFEEKAQSFHDDLGNESDPMWAKVVTMGSQLCPNSDLFGGSSADALKEDLQGAVEAGDDDLLDFDFDIDADSADGDSSGIDLEADNVFAELEAATGDAPAAKPEEDAGLDFDMGGSTDEPVAASEEKAEDSTGLDFDVSSLDFDLDTDSAGTVDADDGGLDFDLDEADETPAEDAPAATEASAEGDELDDELDDVFGEVDEVGTKLDLAKAYVDMGDGDGARSILDEVMEEGNDDQKKLAEELLSQL